MNFTSAIGLFDSQALVLKLHLSYKGVVKEICYFIKDSFLPLSVTNLIRILSSKHYLTHVK